ncbi:hypothetical protein NAEGRDRAFT_65633 [Naegleria gruberi]|uniref:EB1 C-terminal domain-containing protein n=1 Tax=Naegleria gruberi TaxID=5762 RepID=D2V9U6_NAEGR|nr:uncharacterized protein NAEGRDRAFT_65633 [Naegleria gruberi]EFC46308.1 hypothetical protein NAEGRDRAFT_65633 [Naegleria gruberi]|eukprot:XP_002679052.1 hypothetical protein NAEGRDRAFT_65633 [Naegleria gruberi strain NEG-M]
MFPEQLPLTRINFNATYPLDRKGNLDKLQKLFSQLKIPYSIPSDKISNGKLQDNIEFLQWIYTFAARNFETIDNSEVTDRRETAVCALGRKQKSNPPINYIKNAEYRKKLFPILAEQDIENFLRQDDMYNDDLNDYLPTSQEDIDHFCSQLEQEIRLKLERNEKKYEYLQELIEQRNMMFEKLLLVEGVCTVRSTETDENTHEALNFLIRLLRAHMK